MSLSLLLTQFAGNYATAITEPYSGHWLGTLVRSDLRDAVLATAGTSFIAKGSVGNGRWANVPWLGIFHPLETNTAQSGFYVVYLLNPTERKIYLSLNQGVTEARNETKTKSASLDLLRTRAKILRNRIESVPSEISEIEINLGFAEGLGAEYEAAHVLGTSYNCAELANASRVDRDLSTILSVYKGLLTSEGYSIADDIEQDEFPKVTERKKKVLHARFDRLGNVSSKVKKVKGSTCEACGFNFEEIYGGLGSNFIEIHHLVPFSELSVETSRQLDPIRDFAALCANCHRMIHRLDDPSDLEALKMLLRKN